MGSSLSTAVEPHDEVTVVSAGAGAETQEDAAILRQLAELQHSLPLIPESITEQSMWSRSLPRLASASGSSTSSAQGMLDAGLLEQLVTDYQQYTRQQCSRVAAEQNRLNAAVPKLERQAVQLQQRLAEAAKSAATARSNFSAVAAVHQELDALAARLERLQQSLGEVEQEVQQRRGGGG